MKKQLLFLVMMLLPFVASAHDIEVKNGDGVTIYYNYTNDATELEVTYRGSSAYYDNRYTGKVVIPKEVTYMNRIRKVTSIGKSAFYYCSGLTSVIIPNSVTSIGSYAFRECSGLTSITIPNSVTSIGDDAFQSCSKLTSITIPNSVTSIGSGAFYHCSGLTSVTIPNSVMSIGSSAFSGCSGLKSITIPNSMTYIGYSVFSGCSGLKSITIPNCVTSIGDYAFQSCSKLTSITIPDSVTSIGGSAFSGCSSLTSVTIPNRVTSIGSAVFAGCTGLTSVTIPTTVTSIEKDSFSGCPNISDINISVTDFAAFCNNKIVKLVLDLIKTSPKISLIDSEGNEIHEYVIPDGVTSIGQYAFYSCSGLNSVTIGNSVTSIDENAFERCSALTSITIGNSVTSIGSGAFADCTGLTSITIPNSVTSIGNNAFNGSGWYNKQNDGNLYLCNWILGYKGNKPTGDMMIVNGTKGIGDSAFYGCSGLISITIPNSVTSIGDAAFASCTSLASVVIGNNVTSIGYQVFSGCSGLTSITIPNSVTSIGSSAFAACKGLTSIIIGNSVTSIGQYAFSDCSGLTSITIPNSVTSIGSSAFSGCSNISDVNIPVTDFAAFCNNTIINLLRNTIKTSPKISLIDSEGNEIHEYVIPDGVTNIGSYAFSGCSGLTSIEIPNSVTSISNNAFNNCSNISNINIPVTDFAAFCNNKIVKLILDVIKTSPKISLIDSEGNEIHEYVIPDGVTSIGDYAFYNCKNLTSITIPNSVTSIGSSAFSGCSNISDINISVIDLAAFCNNKIVKLVLDVIKTSPKISLIDSEGNEIQEYVIPDGVTSIGSYAFYGISSLTSFEIPNSVTSIGDKAFNGSGWYNNQNDGILYLCNWLLGYKGNKPTGDLKIIIGTKRIRSSAFYECTGLTSITIPNSVTNIGDNAFYKCSGLNSVTIANSVTSIGSYAFYGCSGLTSIEIPNCVTSIEDYAFSYCDHLTSVTLSKNLNSIGKGAFYNCGRLSSINCLNPIPPSTNGDTFVCKVNDYVRDKNDIYNYAILNIPKGCKEAYSAAAEWRYFKNIKGIGEDSEQVSFANLTIQLGTTGYTRQSVKTMESYTFYIGSYGENKVNAVTFNGEDVTNRVNNGYYTTPEITSASILSVTYEATSSAIQAVKQSNLKVMGYHGEINVENIESISDVTVYTVDGKLVDSIPSAFGSVRLLVPANQLYIVKVANRTFKLAM